MSLLGFSVVSNRFLNPCAVKTPMFYFTYSTNRILTITANPVSFGFNAGLAWPKNHNLTPKGSKVTEVTAFLSR